jgi:hypothetical protein
MCTQEFESDKMPSHTVYAQPMGAYMEVEDYVNRRNDLQLSNALAPWDKDLGWTADHTPKWNLA